MTEQQVPGRRWTPARVAAAAAVAVVGITAPVLAIRSGRADSAALFVGVPLALAVALVLAPPAKSLHGLTFRLVTFGLLLTSAFLHEGAACVLMAAPLVYGVAHLIAAIAQYARRSVQHRSALLVIPLLVLAGTEGAVPGLRAMPEQTVTAERVVAAAPADLERRLADGPEFAGVEKPRLLRISGYPVPTGASGAGLEVGDRWTFAMAGGPIVTEVVEREPGRVVFRTVSDSSKTQRWLSWRESVLTWRAEGDGTRLRVETSFVRRLDPSWYFGPIEAAMVGAGIQHFADALAGTGTRG